MSELEVRNELRYGYCLDSPSDDEGWKGDLHQHSSSDFRLFLCIKPLAVLTVTDFSARAVEETSFGAMPPKQLAIGRYTVEPTAD